MMAIAGYKIIESKYAVRQEGYIVREVQRERTWWERFFDPDPTRPLWQKTKTVEVRVPDWKPLIVVNHLTQTIICPPSAVESIKAQLSRKPSDVYRF